MIIKPLKLTVEIPARHGKLSSPVHTYPDIFESTTFSFRIKKFPRPYVAYSNLIRTQGFSAIKCVQSMRHKARDSGGNFFLLLLLCRHIGLLFCKRLDTNLLRHRIRKYPDSPVHTLSDSLRIYFFPLWKADLKIPGFTVKFVFFLDSKISPSTRSVLKSNSPVNTHPMVSGFSDSLQYPRLLCNKMCSEHAP